MSPIDRAARLIQIRDQKTRLDRDHDNNRARLENELLREEQEWWAARLELDSEEGDLLRELDAEDNADDPDCAFIPEEMSR